jgi:hypothetical protein
MKETDSGNEKWLASIDVTLSESCGSPVNFAEISLLQFLSLFLILNLIKLIGTLSHLT